MTTKLDYSILDDDFFCPMADRLLNGCNLSVNGKKFRLVEIEFYLKSAKHPDPYVHCDSDQLLMNTFYFHKFASGTYKSGTFKGMDLTFGSDKKKAYFGILVRSIQDLDTNNVIEGPCNCVNKILSEYDCENVMDFTNGENLNIYDNEKNFVLEINEDLEKEPVWSGPRIGLSAKYPDYQKRSYRFLILKDKIKKQKSGLVQNYVEV